MTVAAALCATALSAQADYTSTVLSLNPVAYYRLNDTTSPAADFSTNLGSLGAAANAYYNGVFGTDYTHPVAGALANGSDTAVQTLTGRGCIVVPHNDLLTNTFSYECWFNPTGSGAAVMSDVDFLSDGRHGFIFYYGVNATWDIRIYNGAGTSLAANIEDNTVVTPVNGWYHFVITCDGSTVVLYVNGQQITNSPFVYYSPAPAAPFIIGSRSDGSYTLDGSYDEGAVYTNALSAAQVLAHFQNGTNTSPAQSYQSLILADHPVGYWRFSEPTFTPTAPPAANIGTLGSSANGTYDPDVVADVAGPPFAGITGGAAAWFNGVVGDIDITPVTTAGGIFTAQTITLWFQMDAWANQWQSLVGQDDNAFRLGRYAATSQIEYGLFTSSPAYFGNETASQISDTIWHHIAAKFNGTNGYIYLDGVLNTNWSALGDSIFSGSSSPVQIGNNAGWNVGRTWAGSISEVAIFDRGLTDAEIQQVYNAAEPSPTIYAQPTVTPPIYEGETVTMTCGATGALPLSYVWTENGSVLPSQTGTNLTLTDITVAANSGTYAVVITNNYGAVTSAPVVLDVIAGPPFVVQQPSSASRALGGHVTFTVGAAGPTPITLQWYHGATPIVGATNASLTLADIQSSDGGNYSVQLTNSYGTATSDTVTLTISAVTGYESLVMSMGPYAYWPLNETNGATATDIAGGFDGAIVGSMVLGAAGANTSEGFAGFGSGHTAYQFDGVSSFVNCGTSVDLSRTNFTMAVWFMVNSFPGAGVYQTLIAKGDSSWRIIRYYNTDYLTPAVNGINPISVAFLQDPADTIDDGAWHLAVDTINDGVHSFYYDGVLDVSGAGYGQLSENSYPAYIGENAEVTGRVWPGLMSDVTLFNHALSAAEVSNLWQFARSGPGAPVIGVQPMSQTVLLGQSASFDALLTAGSGPVGYQWRKDTTPIGGATGQTFTIPQAGYADAAQYDVVITNSLGSTTSQAAHLAVLPPATFANLTNGLVLHLKFDGDLTDSSGHANNGIAGGAPTFVPGKLGQAVHVNSDKTSSTFNYVSVPYTSDFAFGTNLSVSFWVRYTGLPNNLPMIGNSINSTYQHGWVLTDDAGKIEWSLDAIDDTGARINDPVQSSPIINDGNWHQVVMVVSYSGDAITTCVDGVCIDNSPLGPLASVDTSSPIAIGQDPSGTYAGFGPSSAAYDIDDVGIWARALSQVEAESIYAAGQSGQSFDVYGPVKLSVQAAGSSIEVEWAAGTLLSADSLGGPWTPVTNAAAPYYKVTPLGGAKFYRVKL